MSLEEIRHFRNAKPFVPFDIVLRDGKVIHVARVERIGIAPWGKLHVWVGADSHLFDIKEVENARPASQAAA
jgi:hypothetical protein